MLNPIEINALSKRYKEKQAVDGLTLAVETGSIFALVGPNGAGKTTTIKLLLNIIKPDSGQASVLGVDSRKLGPRELSQIGYVSENQELPEWMSVADFLSFCRAMYPQWDDAFAGNLVRRFSVPINQKLGSLSRGMKMKAALISSLAYHPRLLVLDEPFSGLDPFVREEFIEGMLQITESEEWTIFISSHDIYEVERLCDHIAVLNQGRAEIVDETERLQQRFKRVEAAFTAPFTAPGCWPEHWLFPEHQGRALRFIHADFSEDAENEIRALLPQIDYLQMSDMSLRDILIVLARRFRLTGEEREPK